jgi:hypothetical protein
MAGQLDGGETIYTFFHFCDCANPSTFHLRHSRSGTNINSGADLWGSNWSFGCACHVVPLAWDVAVLGAFGPIENLGQTQLVRRTTFRLLVWKRFLLLLRVPATSTRKRSRIKCPSGESFLRGRGALASWDFDCVCWLKEDRPVLIPANTSPNHRSSLGISKLFHR